MQAEGEFRPACFILSRDPCGTQIALSSRLVTIMKRKRLMVKSHLLVVLAVMWFLFGFFVERGLGL